MITAILLAVIIWLLWNIQQNLEEANDRQRNVTEQLSKLLNKLDDKPTVKTSKPTTTENKTADKVSLNSASKAALRKLPKVGAVVAERIIEARPFTSIEQLKTVEGISDSLFAELQDKVSLD